MAINRISNINIKDRGLFTAIYGNVNEEEYFVDNDLKSYSLSQALYLYLKSQGFNSVVFYDSSDNFHSFIQKDLVSFLKSDTQFKSTQKQMEDDWEIAGPFGKDSEVDKTIAKPPTDKPVDDTILPPDEYDAPSDKYFRTHQKAHLLDYLKKNLQNETKCAFVITQPESTRFENENDFVILLSKLNKNYAKNKSQNKIIVVYGSNNSHSLMDNINRLTGYLFMNTFFKGIFFNVDGENYKIKENTTFQIGFPEQKEIKNWLNRKRILEQIELFNSVPFDKINLRLTQERKQIKELDSIDLLGYINNINTKSAWDLLDELKGIDEIKLQFKKLIKARKRNQEATTGSRFRPHMCFKGSPGTGKTTVAEIFSEILKEENVLELGQLVRVTVGDLVGEYIGATRIKTQTVCDKAKGGVLFIDEAYGLLDNAENGYGKEAIEVLIQFMENNDDSLVILAGYTDKVDKLLKEGNDGFTGRFIKSNHFIFQDYPPKVLCDIAKAKLEKFKTTEEFLSSICKILAIQFNRRNAQWSNAREVENLVQEILTEFYCTDDTEIDVKHIPLQYLNLIDPKAAKADSSSSGISKLNSLIGLSQMKSTLKRILNSIKADKVRSERSGKVAKGYKLNFVFRGNPGTGKTTVAEMLGEVLTDYGLLNDPKVEICRRQHVISGYQGQTALKVDEIFTNAIGKVLFIDEAYSICTGDNDDYGKEALSVIVGNLTDNKFQGKMAFVIAGYTDEINEFISQNQGLQSRFNLYVDFEDYSNEELWEIYRKMLSDLDTPLAVSEACKSLAIRWFSEFPRDKNFANAREAENLVGITKTNLDARLAPFDLETLPDETLHTITEIDFPNYNPDSNEEVKPIHPLVNNNTSNSGIPISISIDQKFNNSNPLSSVGLLKTANNCGTAFVFTKDGYVITADHVVNAPIQSTFIYHNDKIEYDTELVWSSKEIDIAILKIISDKQNFIPLNLCMERSDPKVGEELALIGYPMGNQLSPDPFYSESIVANFTKNFTGQEQKCFDAIASYTNATGGYSGGPLIRKSDNRVIGVLHGGLPDSGNINYASDIRQILNRSDITFNIINSTNNDDQSEVSAKVEVTLANDPVVLPEERKFILYGEELPDEKLYNAIKSILFDYCIIDTNIWMNIDAVFRRNNLNSIKVLMNIYTFFEKSLIAHGKTYEELKRIKENKESKYSREVSLSAVDGFNLLSDGNENGLIGIPELGGEHDRKAYADLAIYEYASNKYKENKSVVLLSNDKDCRIRVRSALEGFNSAVEFKFIKAPELKKTTSLIFFSDWYQRTFPQV